MGRVRGICFLLALAVAAALLTLPWWGDSVSALLADTPSMGLTIQVTDVSLPADRKAVVTLKVTDAQGRPLSLGDLDTGSLRGTIARIDTDAATGLTNYFNYILVNNTGNTYIWDGVVQQPALKQGVQPNRSGDTTGTIQDLGNGVHKYTFGAVLPEDYPREATHAIGMQATRGNRTWAANDVFYLVPAGGSPTVMRQVVNTASCNQCHDPLKIHGSSRVDTRLCVLCHTPQNVDLESGNSLDLKVMVHRIHYGANSPAVKAGSPYFINSQNGDRSTVVFPQFGGVNGSTIGDVRTCTVCHGAPPKAGVDKATYPAVQFPTPVMSDADYAKLAPNADNYKTAPSRAACGACHNQIDWATGKALFNGPAGTMRDHPGGAQQNDQLCAVCHQADTGQEFDASVVGAHIIPARSNQLKGYKVDIVSVSDTGPGQKPTVVFTVKDKNGADVLKAEIDTLSFDVRGPTTDYVWAPTAALAKAAEAADLTKVIDRGDGTFSYTLANAIPADTWGTWAIGIESRRTAQAIKGNEGAQVNVNQFTYNPVVYVPVTDTEPMPRRQVVATSKCNVCHGEIAFHGGGRRTPSELCVLCHNPSNVDNPGGVPAASGGPVDAPPQSINFKFMIHRIHTGEELARDFTIYRSQGSGIFNFNEVRFPGDRRNCVKCHITGSNLLPLNETAASTVAPREFYSPLGPAAAACLGCHDSKKASAHAETMTSDKVGEACAVCHQEGRDFAVSEVHRRP